MTEDYSIGRNKIVAKVNGKRRVIEVADTGVGRAFQKSPDLETTARQLVWDWLSTLPNVTLETPRPQ
jgi:hypothetical protein